MFKVREHDNILSIVLNQHGYFAHKNILASSSPYLRYNLKIYLSEIN